MQKLLLTADQKKRVSNCPTVKFVILEVRRRQKGREGGRERKKGKEWERDE